MKVIAYGDGRLIVPARAEDRGALGDGTIEIDETHPDYPDWLRWIERNPRSVTRRKIVRRKGVE